MNNKLKVAISFFIFFSISVLLISSCQTEEGTLDIKSGPVANAKKWLEINKPKLQALDYTKKIDWQNAFVTDGDDGRVVEVPLILFTNTSTNVGEDDSYKTYMRLLFMEDKNASYKVYTIVITTKDLAFDNKNKELNFYKVDPDYSGYLTLQNSKNKILYSGKYKKGKRIGTPRRTKDTTARWVCSYTVTVGTYSTCSNWYWVWDPNDPEWLLVQYGWNNLDDYNNTYGNGSNSDPLPDPCQTSYLTTSTSEGSNYISAKNSIINASADGLEHSITLGIDNANNLLQSSMNTGGPVSVVTNTSLAGAYAGLHNHPNNTPISGGDIYAAVKLNEKSANFTTSFVFTEGDTYAIVIHDLAAAQKFVSDYPADQLPGMNPEFPDFIFEQIDILKKSMGQSIEARTKAISFVLNNYNSGMTFMKQGSDGKFIPFIIEESTQNGIKTYTQKQPCN